LFNRNFTLVKNQ